MRSSIVVRACSLPALLACVGTLAACARGEGASFGGGTGTDTGLVIGAGSGTFSPAESGSAASGAGTNMLGAVTTMPSSDAGHMTRCNDAGQCSCISIASIGHEGVWGACSMDTTTDFQNWLNTQSTATVDSYDTTKPTLTADFLAKYDVVILQWMVEDGKQNDDGAAWVFSPAEIAALQDWVSHGGGVIALNGYQCQLDGCTPVDVTATNQLLSFTDIHFNSDDAFDPLKTGQNPYCWFGALPVGAGFPDAGYPSTCSWDQTTPIGAHVDNLVARVARTIQSAGATVDCTDGTNKYVVHEGVGQGHIVAYGDEWVTYSGEWSGTAKCASANMFDGSANDPCFMQSPNQVFQIPQFWYNAIKYAAASVECFDIKTPGIIH
jgi:hypothetical protein